MVSDQIDRLFKIRLVLDFFCLFKTRPDPIQYLMFDLKFGPVQDWFYAVSIEEKLIKFIIFIKTIRKKFSNIYIKKLLFLEVLLTTVLM